MWNEDGGAYALLGPSGCGKTTMLNCLSLAIPRNERILTVEDELVSQTMAEAFIHRGVDLVTSIGGIERIEENLEKLGIDALVAIVAAARRAHPVRWRATPVIARGRLS